MATDKRERQRANRQQRLIELQRDARRTKTKRTALRVAIGVPLAVAVVFGLIYLVGDDDDADTTTAPTTTVTELTTTSVDPDASTTTLDPNATTTTVAPPVFEYGTGGCPAADGSSVRKVTFDAAPKLCIDPAASYTATFATSKGDIEVELDTPTSPGTVNNFVVLSLFHYYDDTTIFRTDPSIDIIQGGGADSSDSVGYTIPDEGFGFTYSEGDLVMARTGEANSAGGQWFFVGGPDATGLDAQGTYVTFGKVTDGLDVVKDILALAGEDGQTPTETVTLETVTIATA